MPLLPIKCVYFIQMNVCRIKVRILLVDVSHWPTFDITLYVVSLVVFFKGKVQYNSDNNLLC